MFAKLTDVQLNHIPYKGSGQAVVDLIGGQVNMNFDTMPPVLEHIKSGKLRALAISTPQRSQLPDVPTFTEVGITGFEVTNWYSVMGPKGLPADVVAKIDDAVKKAMNDPAIRASLGRARRAVRRRSDAGAVLGLHQGRARQYQKLVKDLNVKAN